MYDPIKFKFYYEYIVNQIYSENQAGGNNSMTKFVMKEFINPMNLEKNARILDVGCGVGHFLEEMRQSGYTNIQGITYSDEDIDVCNSNGYSVAKGDISFLSDKDCSVDFIFNRHTLEHSPFPFITLLEYNRVIKKFGKMYIEMPTPDNCRWIASERNPNHYSIMGLEMLRSLLARSGFDIDRVDMIHWEINGSIDTCYGMIVTKNRSIDIK